MKKALLVLDNPHREMRGMLAVSQRLKKNKIFSYIVSKNTFNHWYEIFNPDFVILPRATSPFIPFIKKNHMNTKIIIIPIEHGSGVEEKVLSHNFGPYFCSHQRIDSAIQLASLVLVSGHNQKKWLSKACPSLTEKIKVIGTLNSDHWFKNKNVNKTDKKVGICTTFKSIFFTSNFNSTFKILYEHLSKDYAANRWRLNFQNYEMHYLSFLHEAIDELTDNGFSVEIRPHPHENWDDWLKWIGSVKNKKLISLNRDLDITKWIDTLNVCITSFSSTTFDCISRNIPTISLDELVKSKIYDLPKNKTPLTGKFSWRPRSIKEMKDLINKAANDELTISPELNLAKDFMKENFFWPRVKSSATLCVDKILELNDLGIKTKKRSFKSIIKIPLILLKIFYRDFMDYFFHPRKSNLLFIFSFRSWYLAYKFNKDIKA